MAAPNLVAPANAKGDTARVDALVAGADLIPAVATGHVWILDAIMCVNNHASETHTITVVHKRGGVEKKVFPKLKINAGQMDNALSGSPFVVPEGDSIVVYADTDGIWTCFAPYTDVS